MSSQIATEPLKIDAGALGGRQLRPWYQNGLALTATRFEPKATLPAHAHERATINVVTKGNYQETLGNGRTFSHPPTSLIVKPGGTVHSNLFSARVECLVLEASELTPDVP